MSWREQWVGKVAVVPEARWHRIRDRETAGKEASLCCRNIPPDEGGEEFVQAHCGLGGWQSLHSVMSPRVQLDVFRAGSKLLSVAVYILCSGRRNDQSKPDNDMSGRRMDRLQASTSGTVFP